MPGKPVQRVGDANSGAGIALGPGHNNVLINGRPALKPFTKFTPHVGCGPKGRQHCVGVVGVIGNATTVFANGQPLVLTGATDSCKTHKRIGGSANVLAK